MLFELDEKLYNFLAVLFCIAIDNKYMIQHSNSPELISPELGVIAVNFQLHNYLQHCLALVEKLNSSIYIMTNNLPV